MSQDNRKRLDLVVAAADELVALVRGVESVGGSRGDSSGLVMFGAYRAGFRRFLAIRNLAHDGWAEEAEILTRSLVSILGRAAWIDSPSQKEDRRERFRRLLRRQYEDDLHELELEIATGVEIDRENLELTRQNLKELDDDRVGRMPNDKQLFQSLRLDPLYARIYTPFSNSMHFSLSKAIVELLHADEIALEATKYDDSADVLLRAMITYGTLLLASDRTVRHGLSDSANDVGRRLTETLGMVSN
jgi:hypothetical protein